MLPAPLPRATPEQLATLAPLAGLTHERLAELADVALVERAPRGSDPLKERPKATQSVFLLEGELLVVFQGGGTLVVVGGTEDARHALNRQKQKVVRTKAITDVDLLAVDDEVLDILATWDQVAAAGAESDSSPMARAMITGAFSLGNLRGGAFAQLPAAHIEELLKRFQHVKAARGEVVIREGDEGDFYYVIESGRFQVERLVGGAKVVLAELKSGDAFGEEALVSEGSGSMCAIPRNTSTTSCRGRSTCRSPRCATCSPCSTARRNMWRIARAGGAAPPRRSCSRSAASGCGCWRAVCAARKGSRKGRNSLKIMGPEATMRV